MRCALRQRSAGRCGAGGATLPPARPRAAALVDRGDAAGSCDPSDPPALRGDSAPPTYEQCAGIRLRPRQRPLAPVRYLSDGQFALDHAASDGHSCGCSSGPPGFLKPRQLQLPRSRPDGQPIESSHLEQVEALRTKAQSFAPSDRSYDALMHRGLTLSHSAWIRADDRRLELRRGWRRFFSRYDALICPVTTAPAYPHSKGVARRDQYFPVNGERRPAADNYYWIGLPNLSYLPA